MDIHFYWLQDQIKQGNFHVLCKLVTVNLGVTLQSIDHHTITDKSLQYTYTLSITQRNILQ